MQKSRQTQIVLFLNFPMLMLLSGCSWINSSLVTSQFSSTTTSGCSGSGLTSTPYASGSGSSADPYLICTTSQWGNLATRSQDWSSSFKLGANLDMTGVAASAIKVGTSTTPFTGSLDGGEFTISNVTLPTSTTSNALFPYVGASSFSNLTLRSFTVSGDSHVAALVGLASNGAVSLTSITVNTFSANYTGSVANIGIGAVVAHANNSVVTATSITLSSLNFTSSGLSVDYCAGVVGYSNRSFSISRFSASGVTISGCFGGGSSIAGSMAGPNDGTVNTATIRDGTVSNFSLTGDGAAVLSNADNSTIERVAVSGATISGSNVGGVLFSASTTTNLGVETAATHALTDVSFQGSVTSSGGNVGGIIGAFAGGVTLTRVKYIGPLTKAATTGLGGLVGTQIASALPTVTLDIIDSSFQGTITGPGIALPRTGGLIGRLTNGATVTNIIRSYGASVITPVAGTTRCIIGASSGTVTGTDVYYDSTLCTHGNAVVGVTGLATGAMQTAAPFTNWLTSVWNFSAGAYPSLVGF